MTKIETARKQQALAVAEILGKKFPTPKTELVYQTPFQLLIATLLAAQCTDKRVNQVTEVLFAKHPDVQSLSKLMLDEIKEYIKSINFFNNKAKHVYELCIKLIEQFGGEVPQTLEELTSLPGVGRKTAHVVMSNIFGKAVLAVDTHVFRVSNRIGLAKAKTVLETESQLMKIIPPEIIGDFHHYLILHGRYTCKAQSPQCQVCEIVDLCNYYRKELRSKQKLASIAKPSKRALKTNLTN